MRGWLNLYPRLQKHACGVPIVVTYHDLLPPYLFPKAGPLRKWTVRQLAQHADGVIVTNDSDYTELTAALGAARPPVRLIPIGSNIAPHPPANYDRAAWRIAHNFTPDTLLIGFFGFLNRSKGIETLIDAARLLADNGLPIHLLFIGGRTGSSDVTNARYADEIDARIERLGLTARVHRTGFTAPPEVSAALLAADVCALPYRSGANFRRGTLHAALAHGNAIVTTTPSAPGTASLSSASPSPPAMPQLRHGENVLLVPPEDAPALAAAIRDLWQHPETRAALGERAAALSEEFSWERIAAHTAEFFRTLTQK
jgi:glycosyltransferase involved in cell wall biosynthesis